MSARQATIIIVLLAALLAVVLFVSAQLATIEQLVRSGTSY